MNVIIAGAGVGGLVTALMLHARGTDCEVFKQANAVCELGVGRIYELLAENRFPGSSISRINADKINFEFPSPCPISDFHPVLRRHLRTWRHAFSDAPAQQSSRFHPPVSNTPFRGCVHFCAGGEVPGDILRQLYNDLQEALALPGFD